MTHSPHRSLLFVTVLLSLLTACMPARATADPTQVANQVETSVPLTLTAISTSAQPTDTPLPPPTESVPPTPTFALPPILLPTATANPLPAYACDIINQRPLDDTAFHPGDSFDVKWTIVNTGTLRWEDDTYLEYQSGPEMTAVTKIELPRLKAGERHEVILDAAAPDELDRQIMVWAVHGPGVVKNSMYWMCYPYVRIIVDR